MQLSAPIVHAGLPEVLGWMLIAAGIGLALQTLAPVGWSDHRLARLLRAWDALDWAFLRRPAERMKPTQLAQVRELDTDQTRTEPDRLALIADLHVRATEELEAAEDALTELLEFVATHGLLPLVSPSPVPAEPVQPIAA
jgi:hypothetical protein